VGDVLVGGDLDGKVIRVPASGNESGLEVRHLDAATLAAELLAQVSLDDEVSLDDFDFFADVICAGPE
jgi:hypothetical protein